MKFKSGEKVAVYAGCGRRVMEVVGDIPDKNGCLTVREIGDKTKWNVLVHPKQLRKLKKRRVWWLNIESAWKNWFDVKSGSIISATEPEDKTGWIKMVEAKGRSNE